VVLGTYTGTHKATGKDVRAQFAHVWAVKGARVLRFQQYTDTKQFAEVIA
jgi:ketosteroid isomerase-like protein